MKRYSHTSGLSFTIRNYYIAFTYDESNDLNVNKLFRVDASNNTHNVSAHRYLRH